MARAFSLVYSSIWNDKDFLNLDPAEQRLYVFLTSQPDLTHAGVLPLTLGRWTPKARGLTRGLLEAQLATLAATRFVVLDADTEELLIRRHVFWDKVFKQPRIMGAMVSAAQAIASEKLRWVLLQEVGRLPLDELSDEPGTKGSPSVRSQIDAHIKALWDAIGSTPPPAEPLAQPVAQPHREALGEDLPQAPAEQVAQPSAQGHPDDPADPLAQPPEQAPRQPLPEGVGQEGTEPPAQPLPQGVAQGQAEPVANPLPDGVTHGPAQPLPQGVGEGVPEPPTEALPQPPAEPLTQGVRQAHPQPHPQPSTRVGAPPHPRSLPLPLHPSPSTTTTTSPSPTSPQQHPTDDGGGGKNLPDDSEARILLMCLAPRWLVPGGTGPAIEELVAAVANALGPLGWPSEAVTRALTENVPQRGNISSLPRFLLARVPSLPYVAPRVPTCSMHRLPLPCSDCAALPRAEYDAERVAAGIAALKAAKRPLLDWPATDTTQPSEDDT